MASLKAQNQLEAPLSEEDGRKFATPSSAEFKHRNDSFVAQSVYIFRMDVKEPSAQVATPVVLIQVWEVPASGLPPYLTEFALLSKESLARGFS